jgi:hypothetical protein
MHREWLRLLLEDIKPSALAGRSPAVITGVDPVLF